MAGAGSWMKDKGKVAGGGEFFGTHAAGCVVTGPTFQKQEFAAFPIVSGEDGGMQRGIGIGPGSTFGRKNKGSDIW